MFHLIFKIQVESYFETLKENCLEIYVNEMPDILAVDEAFVDSDELAATHSKAWTKASTRVRSTVFCFK